MQFNLKKYYSILSLFLVLVVLNNYCVKTGIVSVLFPQEEKTEVNNTEKKENTTSSIVIYQTSQEALLPLANFEFASFFKVIYIFDFPPTILKIHFPEIKLFIIPYFTNVFTNIIAINAP